GGLNFESRGGDGFVVGSRARSPKAAMFKNLMHYDSGGYLFPGDVGVNKSGGRERVLTSSETKAYESFTPATIGAAVADAIGGTTLALQFGSETVLARVVERGQRRRDSRR
ncbi:MAG: hypothetical protein ACRDUA_10500, partial [Micromonosporaceae bacterium]